MEIVKVKTMPLIDLYRESTTLMRRKLALVKKFLIEKNLESEEELVEVQNTLGIYQKEIFKRRDILRASGNTTHEELEDLALAVFQVKDNLTPSFVKSPPILIKKVYEELKGQLAWVDNLNQSALEKVKTPEVTMEDRIEVYSESCVRKGYPNFIPTGQCPSCQRNLLDGIPIENVPSLALSGCPYCHRSFCS